MRIYLVGLPGVGKSYLGKALAKKLSYPFFDTDEEIEKIHQEKIADIFLKYGENTFRQWETDVLYQINAPSAVIATGGGIVKNKQNKALMQGFIVWVDCQMDLLVNRLSNDETVRPLLKTKSVFDLYKERFSLYQYFGDIHVFNHNSEETMQIILKAMEEKKCAF